MLTARNMLKVGLLILIRPHKQKAPAVKLGPLSKPKLGGLPCKHDRGKGE